MYLVATSVKGISMTGADQVLLRCVHFHRTTSSLNIITKTSSLILIVFKHSKFHHNVLLVMKPVPSLTLAQTGI